MSYRLRTISRGTHETDLKALGIALPQFNGAVSAAVVRATGAGLRDSRRRHYGNIVNHINDDMTLVRERLEWKWAARPNSNTFNACQRGSARKCGFVLSQ